MQKMLGFVADVQSLSHVPLFATPWTAHTRLPNPLPSPRVCSDSHPLSQWCHPTTSSSVIPSDIPRGCHHPMSSSLNLSSIRVFSSELALHISWSKYWTLSFSISPSNEHPGLIPLGFDWFDLAAQETFKSLHQHHSSKASIYGHSAFLMVQLSHPYMTTGKTIALTLQTFVGKVMFLLFNMLSRLFIAFFPRSKRLLISWLQPPSAVILEPRK